MDTQAPAIRSAITAASGSIGGSPELRDAKNIILAGRSMPAVEPVHLDKDQTRAFWADLRSRRDRYAQWLLKRASAVPAGPERIVRILKDASISRGRTGFDDRDLARPILQAADTAVATGRPLSLAMIVGGGKVAVPLKTGDHFLADLAEWLALSLLSGMLTALGEVHNGGAGLTLLADAPLHTPDLGFPIEESHEHLRLLALDMAMLNVQEHVRIPPVLPALPADWSEVVTAAQRDVQTRLATDAGFRMDARAQIESLAYSLNTRVLGGSFEEEVLRSAAMSGHVEGIPAHVRAEALEVYRRAEAVFPRYAAVNEAIRRGRLVELAAARAMPDGVYLRMSVHAKPGEPRPALVLPGHLVRSQGLLPMHGLGVRDDSTGDMGLTFELAARTAGWTPVRDHSGRFLYYRPAAVQVSR